jgi:hypothetical protein
MHLYRVQPVAVAGGRGPGADIADFVVNDPLGGFIIEGTQDLRVLVRALGPTLGQPPFNVPGALADPQLTLTTQTGTPLATNDDWQSANSPQDIAEIQASGFAPPDAMEPAIVMSLAPGAYTPIVTGVAGGTGVGIIEVYELP